MAFDLAQSSERGPHAVGVMTLDVADPDDPSRRLPTDLWYPVDSARVAPDARFEAPHPFGQPHEACVDAPAAPGRWPLLAFSHGNSGLRRQSTFLTTHLASHGFVVVAPDHTGNTFPEMLRLDESQRKDVHRFARARRPGDLRAAIDAALRAEGPMPQIDSNRIGALGHSFGGWTALKMPRADARVRVVCGLAPASEPFVGRRAFEEGELPLAVPSLVIAGADDCLVDLDSSIGPLVARLAPPHQLVVARDADHFHFCDGIALLHGMHEKAVRPQQTRFPRPFLDTLPEARVHRLLRGLVTAFFAESLRNERIGSEPLPEFQPEALRAFDDALDRA